MTVYAHALQQGGTGRPRKAHKKIHFTAQVNQKFPSEPENMTANISMLTATTSFNKQKCSFRSRCCVFYSCFPIHKITTAYISSY